MRWIMVAVVTGFLAFHAWVEAADEIEALLQAPEPAQPLQGMIEGAKLPELPPEFPGETTRVVDPYGTNAPNPLFLTALPGKLWWGEEGGARLPVLVTEPIGLSRQNQPVSVVYRFPEGTVPESLHVVTPSGREIPSQARVVDANAKKFEVAFVLDHLDGAAQIPLFVYYGSKPVASSSPPPPDPSLRIENRERGVALLNSRLEAEFAKQAGRNAVSILRLIKGVTAERNQLSLISADRYSGAACGVAADTPLQVIEDGPVRKTVSYGAWGEGYTVSLCANSPLLYIDSRTGTQSWGFWLPGGDTLHDVLAYASPEGLKRMPIQYTGGNVPPFTYERLKKWYTEGWFALLDEVQQQGIGWFFDLEPSRLMLQTVFLGYWVQVSAPGQSALYVAGNARTEPCRDAYIAWKCPPIVSLGAPQPFAPIEPRVPLLGRDFIRMHMEVQRFRPRVDSDSARQYVEEARDFGANVLMYESSGLEYLKPSADADGKPGPSLFDDLVRECHARGMGLYHGLGSHFSVAATRDIVRRGADGVWLCDEWGWGPNGYYPLNEEQRRQFLAGTWNWGHTNFSAAERADFKKRYGADMPGAPEAVERDELTETLAAGRPDPSNPFDDDNLKAKPRGPFHRMAATNLNDRSQFAMFRMMIDAHNLLMSDLAQVARESNSNIFVAATTSPNNLVIPYQSIYTPNSLAAFHDLESLADSLSSIALDLYSNDGGWLNSMIKYARGAQGNRRSMLVIGGYCGWDDRRAVENNLNFQLMFGANSLMYFALDRICTPWPGLGAKDAFEFIDYTGLGAFAAKAWPLEFVGILRDRDEFFASLKRGETATPQGTGSLYDHSIYQYVRAMGFSIPANVIAARHLKAELAAPYRLIIVANNPTLSDANAALLAGFVQAGGHLVLEGSTVRCPAMAALAGVSATGEAKAGKLHLTGAKAPLEGWSADLSCAWQPIEAKAGVQVLATLGQDQPAITMNTAGKGSVVCVAPRIGPQAASGPVGQALRRLVEHAVGYLPVRVEPSGVPTWTTVLTDGERYVIAAFNDSDARAEGLSLVLRGFPTAGGAALVSLRTGRTYPVADGTARNVTLQPRLTDYFMLGSTAPRPQAARQTAKPITQSVTPGMPFLNLPPLPAKSPM